MTSRLQQRFENPSKKSLAGLAIVACATALAAWVEYRSRRAARAHPAEGQFVDVDGVRLPGTSPAEDATNSQPALIAE